MSQTSSRISQLQLASMAGVSPSTVSRALAGHPGISIEVVGRVRSLAEKLNYRPNAAARSFVTRVHNAIGFVLCDRQPVGNYGSMLNSVEEAVRTAGIKLHLSQFQSAQLKGEELPPIFRDDGIDGVILSGDVPRWLLTRLAKWEIPFVLLGSQEGIAGVNHVGGEVSRAGLLLARHLLDLGHREIGLIVGPRRRSAHNTFYRGFVQGGVEAGLDPGWIEQRTQECPTPDVVDPLNRLLEQAPELTAICVNNEEVARQVIQCLRASGRRVPADIGVAGLHTNPQSIRDQWPLQMTAVDTQLVEMARSAVQLLCEVIREPRRAARRLMIEPTIVEGQTVTRRIERVPDSPL